jgi:cytochrome c heme-lyase
MGWWKVDPVLSPSQSSPPVVAPPRVAPAGPISAPSANSPSSCPVDPKTREIWLQQAKSQSKSGFQSQPLPDSHPPILPEAANTFAVSPSTQCSSDTITQHPHPQSSTDSPLPKGFRPLSHDRVVSSIPRANPVASPNTSTIFPPSNSETETGADSATGNWIYPSEYQFFTAVLRKNSLPTSSPDPSSLASTVPSIIPIHNAVNERAWTLIKQWEGNSSASCGGPKLLSFRGLGAGPDEEPGLWGGLVGYARLFDPRTCLSPRARVRALGGYQAPFDRHDWVVERCRGEKVEYVIDFYQGKSKGNEGSAAGGLNFYLDVRPKLNSWEGWRMRGARFMGFEESTKQQKTD